MGIWRHGPLEAKVATPILLIAEDPRWAPLLASYLHNHAFALTATAPASALSALAGAHYAAVLFELGLSGLASLTLLEKLRHEFPVPVLALAESAAAAEHLRTLDLGASDYVARDCAPHELLAVLRRVVRLGGPLAAGHRVLQVRELLLDLDAHRALLGAEPITLSPAEFTLLLTLAQEPGRLFTREQLATAMIVKPAAVDVHVSALRRKLHDDAREPRWIVTVRGEGYLLPAAFSASNSR